MPNSLQISGDVLRWARNTMGYSIDEAASKAGVSSDRIVAWENGTKTPTYRQLETLAEKVFKRSLALLLLQEVPDEKPVQQDFRNLSNAERKTLSPEMRLVVRKAHRYQLILEEIADDSGSRIFDFDVAVSDDPVKAANEFREFLPFGIESQKAWTADAGFREFRKIVESTGVYVFQMKMPFQEARAFCLTGRYPLIVLNTEDSKNARIFSLFHEVCHILFNVNGIFRDEESGTLNKEYEKIEQFCNRFAAAFLVPEDQFDQDLATYRSVPSEQLITKLARQYNVSNEVIARKFLERNLMNNRTFWSLKRLWDSSAIASRKQQNEKMKEKEFGGIEQVKKIFSEKGEPYVEKVITAFNAGRLSSSDVLNYLETKSNHVEKIIKRFNR